MFEFLRTRLAQGTQTSSFPRGDVSFPARFRGLPVLETANCETPDAPLVNGIPTALLQQDTQGKAALDVGACLFCPEEAAGSAGCGIRFSHDYRMAARSREGLVSTTGEIALAAALDRRMQSLLGRSLRLRSVVAGSCGGCEAELVALSNVVFDMARFGIQFVASPRHADGIVITGAVNSNMRDALQRTYDAVPDPRIVIAVGACAASGGPFRGSPELALGVPQTVPVDLWIAGCPPHPLTVLDGLLRLLGRRGSEAEGSSASLLDQSAQGAPTAHGAVGGR